MTKSSHTSAFDLSSEDLLQLFQVGEIQIEGRMRDSSNVTLLVTVKAPESSKLGSHKAIYKPITGERPLRDFPPGLHKREVAMFCLASAFDWDVIPPTAVMEGPLGEGSVQAFVNAQFEHHYFSLLSEGVGVDDLKRLCVLDFISNNTDRKSGHCLLGRNNRVYGIDHGLTFHAQFKLRTVMWDFVGQPLGEDIEKAVRSFVSSGPPEKISQLLDPFEVDAVKTRAKVLVEEGTFPPDDTGGNRLPWPLI